MTPKNQYFLNLECQQLYQFYYIVNMLFGLAIYANTYENKRNPNTFEI